VLVVDPLIIIMEVLVEMDLLDAEEEVEDVE
jgi:hypothetical protein